MPQIKASLGIGFPTATQRETLDIDDGEWADCETDEDKQELIEGYLMEWAWFYIDIGAELIE